MDLLIKHFEAKPEDLIFASENLPLNHFNEIRKVVLSKERKNYSWSLGREILRYFFSGENSVIFQLYHADLVLKTKLKKIRQDINRFVKKITNVSIVSNLEDYCHQQIKYHKEKLERQKGLHICQKCQRRLKTKTNRIKHEITCKKPLLNNIKTSRKKQKEKANSRSKNFAFTLEDKYMEKIKMRYQKGLEVRVVINKQRSIFSLRKFMRGEYVCCYDGKLLSKHEAEKLEHYYEKEGKGCYLFFFKHKGKEFCIDATSESGNFGRLINHSRLKKRMNIIPKVVELNGLPNIVFFAQKEILRGSELLYDYGERRINVIASENYSWLKE